MGVSDRGHPASHGLISGRHLSVDSVISFALEGAGRRRVAFSWGCNRPCGLQKVIADEHILLFDQESGDMRYGSTEFTLDGPEAFVLLTDSEDDEMEMVLDNLEVRELPAGARRSDGRRSALVADVDRDPPSYEMKWREHPPSGVVGRDRPRENVVGNADVIDRRPRALSQGARTLQNR